MKKVLLTAAILFAGTLGFYSCTEEEPAAPTTNVGAQNPDDQKEPEKEPEKEEVDEEAAPADQLLDPVITGNNGSSMFPYSFFRKGDNYDALIGIGRSFHINDPFKATDICFTEKSSDKTNLKHTNSNGETNVEVYYTSNDYEYNTLKSNDYSGSIGFLNIAQLSASRQTSLTTSSFLANERLVFVATINKGQYEYPNLLLTKTANDYLYNKKFDEFKEKYGTHYVYGCEKAVTITVEIICESSTQTVEDITSNGVGATAKYKGVTANFKYDNTNNDCKITNETNTNVKYSSKGVANIGDYISEQAIKDAIKKGKEEKKDIVSTLDQYLKDILSKMNKEEGYVTKYYVKPFTRNGCQGIDWTTEKENLLSAINENYVSTLRLISMAEDFTDNNTIDAIATKLGMSLGNKSFVKYCSSDFKERIGIDIPNNLVASIQDYYVIGDQESEWNAFVTKATDLSRKLKSQFSICSNVAYNIDNMSDDYTSDVKSLFSEYNKLYSKAYDAMVEISDLYKSEASKYPHITLTNKSSYPFKITIKKDGEPFDSFDMKGKETKTLIVEPGTYYIYGKQLSGYMLWATEVSKTYNVEEGKTYTFSFTD